HAEPWDKLVTLTSGRAYTAWVDLRAGRGFGATYALELEPGTAVFVPRGVANGYQTLADDTTYSYLVNDYWRPDLDYVTLDHADRAPALAWPWPHSERVPPERARPAPPLAAVEPLPVRTPLVIGAGGQLGSALVAALPGARGVGRDVIDVTDQDALDAWP